ncbi:MAG: DUF1330 domain-containing protein [Pseudomonadota bacterium]
MTVYAVVQVKIKDRAAYDRYSDAFMDVFSKFKGTMLAADFDPKIIEGDWDKDRIVVMSFPDEASFAAWANSDEYKEIVKHRVQGADLTALLAKGIEA